MKFMRVEIFLIKKKNVICSEKSTLGKMYKAKDFVFLHVKFTKLHVSQSNALITKFASRF